MTTLADVNHLRERTDDAFRRCLVAAARRLDIDPDHLAAVISFESGFLPHNPNPRSGAEGLIQFTHDTARSLGTTVEQLGRMTAIEQIPWVEKYFEPFGVLRTADDVYMAVFAPVGVGKPAGFRLYSDPSKAYTQNRELDADEDGAITKQEAARFVRSLLTAAASRPRLEVSDTPAADSPAEVPGLPQDAPAVAGMGGGGFGFALAALAGAFVLSRGSGRGRGK